MENAKSEPSAELRGIWIPIEIWNDSRLNALEKIILCEIEYLSSRGTDCYASNKYLANVCQCSESKVSKAIAKLTELKYLSAKFDRKKQTLNNNPSKFY